MAKNPYSFDEFVERRDQLDWFLDEPLLHKALKKYTGDKYEQIKEKIIPFSAQVSKRWRDLSEYIARPEAQPYMLHYDAFNRRIDRVVRPMEVHALEKEVFGSALMSSKIDAWESFVKRLLINQLGESGIACPLTCTIGLAAILEQFPNPEYPELEQILRHTKEGIDGEFAIGAQYMTEIQGGSDLPANILEAVPDGKYYRLYGNKFFCSVAHADYAVVTARITGTDKVSTFIVPAWLPGDKEKEKRNGYTINRIKWKMGTSEVPTAEIDYDGALAYPVGDPDRGIAIAVGIVLTLSRLEIGMASAAFMLRAAREARLYSDFRTVFGRKINEYPLSVRQLRRLEQAAERTTAGAFKVYNMFLSMENALQPGLRSNRPLEERKQQFNFRELVLLQKICATNEGAEVLRDAISLFAGHGVMEEFSALPRLFRDIVVNEQWEGPRNLLLTQIYRDIQRVVDWYPPAEFVANILEGAPQEQIDYFSEQLVSLLQKPVLDEVNEESIDAAVEWDEFCDSFFKAYQTIALHELNTVTL